MPESEIYDQIEKYLDSALEILSTWGDWLAEHERRVIEGNNRAIEEHSAEAEPLHADLGWLSSRRAEIIAEARQLGYSCSTLKQLAQGLPQWNSRPDFRQRFKSVERCMANLRRLNTAAWLLVSQCGRVVEDTLLLMTHGSALQSVYVSVPHADTSGGQIFDTQV